MQDRVSVAVVGLGDHGLRHLDILANLADTEVVALVSRNQDRARPLAARYHVPHVFPDTEAMLAHVHPQAVFIANEAGRHREPTLAALHAGADVFLEKPIAGSVHEAREIIEEAERLGRRLMVGHVLRFDPRCTAVKQRLDDGSLGRAVTFYGRRNQSRLLLDIYSDVSRFYTTGIHDLDLMLWYFEGRRPVEAYMKTMSVSGRGDDVFWGMVTMDDGSVGVIETTWILPEATPWRGHVLMEVIGTEGTVLAEVPGNGLTVWGQERVEMPDTGYWPEVQGVTVGALRDEDAYFIRCLREGRPIEMPRPREALAAMELADTLLRSAAEGRPIRP